MKGYAKRFLLVGIGCLLYALSFNLFFDPFRISPGGVSGIAMIISYLTGFPAGMAILLMNVPLIILAWVKIGPDFIVSTAVATAVSSLLIDLTARIPTPVEDYMLATLCGGVLIGIGMGMILRGGATTGGTDIVSKLVWLHRPHLKMGQVVLAVDGAVVLLSALVFRDFALAVYAILGIYICGKLMDTILYGFDFSTLTYIISDRYMEIGDAIQERLERGITYLEAQGGYAGTPKKVILCAIKPKEVPALRAIIEEFDPGAFFIVTEGQRIFGDGFLEAEER